MLAIAQKERCNMLTRRILTVNKRNPTIRIPAQFLNSIEPDKRKSKIKIFLEVKETIIVIGKSK